MKTYTTIQGDTWDGISFKLFGEERFSVQLMNANPGHIETVVFSGNIVLHVPELPAEQSQTLPPWKRED
ncbi:tail protein X [Paenibacillus bouchesdurhonensis]|uniref:tail protein X n=1 Tax=Paenibacillus bouchesdurhonensis TaxID=1870990 RepID=UPI000DA63234|nr:tail protein X [Paenibacillus bouchesdurhonensis]